MTHHERKLTLLDAPSNLGLPPPGEGLVPGCYKAPGVMRDTGLLRRLHAEDAGVVTAGRYRPDHTPGEVRNDGADDTVATGIRPYDECADEAAGNGLHLVAADEVARDPRAAADRALAVVDRAELDGFWIHLDADVLDPELMPAVDAPDPGGLTFEQLTTVLRVLLDSPRATGLDLTIYDPDLDPDLSGGKRLADLLVEALTP